MFKPHHSLLVVGLINALLLGGVFADDAADESNASSISPIKNLRHEFTPEERAQLQASWGKERSQKLTPEEREKIHAERQAKRDEFAKMTPEERQAVFAAKKKEFQEKREKVVAEQNEFAAKSAAAVKTIEELKTQLAAAFTEKPFIAKEIYAAWKTELTKKNSPELLNQLNESYIEFLEKQSPRALMHQWRKNATPEQRERMREKFEKMSPEERQELRKKFEELRPQGHHGKYGKMHAKSGGKSGKVARDR